MELNNLRYEKKGAIATITVIRPKVLNALNAVTVEELFAAFELARNDHEIRVVLLTGEGQKAFIAGADIQELAQANAVTGRAFARRGQQLLYLVEQLGKPVIACVNGYALGGGCELTLACTLRLASENAKFGQPELKLGIIPAYGGSQRLPRLIGKGRALQMFLTGDPISAEEAHRIGLVNEVVPAAELMTRAEAMAAKILSCSPLAVGYCLDAVQHGMEMPLAEGLEHEAALLALSCATEDKAEGTHAFLEKRAPQFQGR